MRGRTTISSGWRSTRTRLRPRQQRRKPHDDANGNRSSDGRPCDDVLAVIDDGARVEATIDALRAAGFTEADIHIFRGREGVTALARAWWGHAGVPAFLAPLVAAVLSDERDIEEIYESEGLAGQTVLAVHTNSPDDVDEATRVLRGWGAHDTWYFGRWTMTPVDPSARHST